MKHLDMLREIRRSVGPADTKGLADGTLEEFLAHDPTLGQAISEAFERFQEYQRQYPELLRMAEPELISELQRGYVNFYPENCVNPYVALAGKGPWIVTLYGAVVHDSGGYGMLGFGHGPDTVIAAMKPNWVMANVMTASITQKRLTDRLLKEIGHSRPAGKTKPFAKFLCLNSGSEAVGVAARIADINAGRLTAEGGRHAGKKIKMLAMKGGFHGRTDRPAMASDSTMAAMAKLASFRRYEGLVTVEPNDIAGLKAAFAKAEADGVFYEFLFMEPVMGEGNPGMAVTPEFYRAARELTQASGTMLLVDSIQAGLRAHGCLSIMDYPGFETCDAPDMETYSKALNAGQYPLSVLALTESAAKIYEKGVYGNTMTTNPRALEVACAVLDLVTPELRRNIKERGQEFVEKFKALGREFPDVVTSVQGTGLLCAIGLKEDGYKVVGFQGVEQTMRRHGIGVIHGGKNALRFTPHFKITSREIDLIIDAIRETLRQGPRYKA